MMLFTEIFIEPERQRIRRLKEKEKEFTDLVYNVVNDQYDKILDYEFKNKKRKVQSANNLGGKSSGKSYGNGRSRRKRPMSSISKTTMALTK